MTSVSKLHSEYNRTSFLFNCTRYPSVTTMVIWYKNLLSYFQFSLS